MRQATDARIEAARQTSDVSDGNWDGPTAVPWRSFVRMGAAAKALAPRRSIVVYEDCCSTVDLSAGPEDGAEPEPQREASPSPFWVAPVPGPIPEPTIRCDCSDEELDPQTETESCEDEDDDVPQEAEETVPTDTQGTTERSGDVAGDAGRRANSSPVEDDCDHADAVLAGFQDSASSQLPFRADKPRETAAGDGCPGDLDDELGVQGASLLPDRVLEGVRRAGLPEPTGEVAEFLAELSDCAELLDPLDYWTGEGWNASALREDVECQREEQAEAESSVVGEPTAPGTWPDPPMAPPAPPMPDGEIGPQQEDAQPPPPPDDPPPELETSAQEEEEEEEAQLQEALRLSRYEALRASLPVSTFQGPRRPQEGAGEEPPECPICLEKFERGDRVLRLECLHLFHEKCADSWLQRSLDCPVCKTSFVTP